LASYISQAGGYLRNGNGDSTSCEYCPIATTNDFLASINSNFDNRWRNFGLLWVYTVFNIAAALFFYWLARVPKGRNVTIRKE
jgi:ATP-binding cassette, subfamily G (WHITE), member 2, PDR